MVTVDGREMSNPESTKAPACSRVVEPQGVRTSLAAWMQPVRRAGAPAGFLLGGIVESPAADIGQVVQALRKVCWCEAQGVLNAQRNFRHFGCAGFYWPRIRNNIASMCSPGPKESLWCVRHPNMPHLSAFAPPNLVGRSESEAVGFGGGSRRGCCRLQKSVLD